MTYRITNNMMQSLLLNDMHTNLNNLLKIQQELSTQRKYNAASDNPNAVTKGMGIETMMTETEQYIKNLNDAVSWLKFTDDALGDMTDLFQRIRELTIYAGDPALTDVDRAAIGEELRQIKKEMMSVANSTIEGEYLFSGLMTGTKAFRLGANGEVVYDGNNYDLFWEFARMETGQVSLTGRDVFPQDETTNYLKGIELPLDFEWEGRNEILEFKVGWQTVKVRIPERWEDEIRNGLDDAGDYNRYRDPGEKLDGYSLTEIANLINNSTEMGDVSSLLKATVVTDQVRGIQYLQIKSLTGESVSLTSWPETDATDLAQGIMGAAYGLAGRTAGTTGKVSIQFGDNSIYTVDVADTDTLEDVARKLNDLPDARIWAAYKTQTIGSETIEWLDIVAREPGSSFTMETTGGAAALFGPGAVFATASKPNIIDPHEILSNALDDPTYPFSTFAAGILTFRQGDYVYNLEVPSGANLAAIAALINTANVVDGLPFTATVTGAGELKIVPDAVFGIDEPFSVTAIGGLTPLFSDGVSAESSPITGNRFQLDTSPVDDAFVTSGEGGFEIEIEGNRYWVPIATGANLNTVMSVIDTALTSILGPGTYEIEIKNKIDDDGNSVSWIQITSDKAIKLDGFGSAAAAIGLNRIGSEAIVTNSDHTHIGFAAMMGMETAIQSQEFAPGVTLGDTTLNPLSIKIISGTRRAEIVINDDADLTLEELAARINGVCGDWFEAVVETDAPDGTDPFLDPLNNSGDNKESATQRLVLRTKDGAPFSVFDSSATAAATRYAETLGINTALTIPNIPVAYPNDGLGSFDEDMPATLEVTVGEHVFHVKVCRNNTATGELVAKQIVDEVNRQYGSALLGITGNALSGGVYDNFSIYSLSGEPLRVVDYHYGDPDFVDFTGGVATQLGLAAGVTGASIPDSTLLTQNGTIRISTPGHSVDIPVLAGEDMRTVANRIRDYAGSWLDVSFSDSDMAAAGGNVQLSLAAKDGSAVTAFDINGDAADIYGLTNALVGTVDLSAWAPIAGETLTISIYGASHTIDLWDSTVSPERPTVNDVNELADMINTRFQGQDIRAEVITDSNGEKHLALYSPKGYKFEVSGVVDAALSISTLEDLGLSTGPATSVSSPVTAYAAGPYNQVVTQRTGDNQKKIDFFGVLDNLVDTAEGGDIDGLSDTMIGELDNWMTTLLKCRAVAGALISRYQTTVNRYITNRTGYTDLHNQTVGADLAETITNYEMASGIYEASLAAIARIIQPTLLDFLR
ncbi:MAG: flagellar hook-associated protein FlgL [Synergistaceae bacterium]|jgi:flagellin-like hook-associated protein FlgL|nr:flagellar hook-associated protein FlgL [Synergistaceae bacterium]